MKKPTADQLKAQNAKEGKFLIAAGAGSGKTRVLTNRVISLIKDKSLGLSFSDLLVLTFTKNAAAEMKGRIRKMVMADADLVQMLPDLEAADITTFDAFALSIVSKYHYELGLPKNIKNLDESIHHLEERRFLEEIMNRKYKEALENPQCVFARLAHDLAFKNDDGLVELILKIVKIADLQDDREAYFDGYDEKYFGDGKYFNDFAERQRLKAVGLLNKAIDRLYQAGANEEHKDIIFLKEILATKDNGLVPFGAKLNEKNFPGKDSINDDADYIAVHYKVNDDFFKPAKAIGSQLENLRNEEISYERTREYVLELLSIAREVGDKVIEFEKEHGSFTFKDIAFYAREVVKKHPEVREELRKKYKFVMVDEYQDTSNLQESFINSLGIENVFEVGDVKQSIFSFRNANPTLIEEKRARYRSPGADGTLIEMMDSFRSREPVIDAVNDLFKVIMTKDCGGVDYSDNQSLLFGQKELFTEEDDRHTPVIVEYELPASVSKGGYEAALIAGDIMRKIKAGYIVYDNDLEIMRPCTYKDFAILVDRRSELNIYKRTFADLKIPFEAAEKGEAKEKDITLVVRNLIELILSLSGKRETNDERLKHLYLSLERSFLLRETDEKIYDIVKSEQFKDSPLFRSARKISEKIDERNLEDIIGDIFDEFFFVEKLPSLGEVKENYAVLERFQKMAKSFAELGYGLVEFSQYFDDIDKFDQPFYIEPSSSGLDCVKFETIHMSKGLEYPVVYVPSLFHIPSKGGKTGVVDYFASGERGVLLPNYDTEGRFIQENMLLLDAKEEAKREKKSERMRLFYVALTRASENLYLIRKNNEGRKDTDGSFADFLAQYPNSKKCFKTETWDIASGPFDVLTDDDEAPEIALVELPPTAAIEKKTHKASKNIASPIPKEILLEGTRLHRLMELVDWKTKDLSWITSTKDKERIEKVVNASLFKDSAKAKAFKEHSFYDYENRISGTIDLFLVYDDHIDLVDYKSSKTDDPEYLEQLDAYARYLEKVFGKKVKKILMSIKDPEHPNVLD